VDSNLVEDYTIVFGAIVEAKMKRFVIKDISTVVESSYAFSNFVG
jgi:hypothetical protein